MFKRDSSLRQNRPSPSRDTSLRSVSSLVLEQSGGRIWILTIVVAVALAVAQTLALADTETLRPNGAGSETNSYILQALDSGEHWDKVDEEVGWGRRC